jgi:CheY-like chemotaxis protein
MSTEHSVRILYLEDNSLDAELVQIELETSNLPCSITRAANYDGFAAALRDGNVDVIISDSGLPGFNSSRALEHVRRNHPQIPFIFLSGNTSPKTRQNALALGAAEYVFKSELSQLVPALRRVCRRKSRAKAGS